MRTLLSLCLAGALLFCIASPAYAQFGVFSSIGNKIGIGGDDEEESPSTPEATDLSEVKDGDVAVIPTLLSPVEASQALRSYLYERGLDFTVNEGTGRVITDWYNERRCGFGFNRCANSAKILVDSTDGETTFQIQVFERKREGGASPGSWSENSKSKGDKTRDFSRDLEEALADIDVSELSAPLVTTESASPPDSEPKILTLGQTIEEVVSTFGNPKSIIDLGGSEKTYIFDDVNVIFTDGTVSDVRLK